MNNYIIILINRMNNYIKNTNEDKSDIKSLHVTYYGWHLPQGLWIIEYFNYLIYTCDFAGVTLPYWYGYQSRWQFNSQWFIGWFTICLWLSYVEHNQDFYFRLTALYGCRVESDCSMSTGKLWLEWQNISAQMNTLLNLGSRTCIRRPYCSHFTAFN